MCFQLTPYTAKNTGVSSGLESREKTAVNATAAAVKAKNAVSMPVNDDTSANTAYAAGKYGLSKNHKILRMTGSRAAALILCLIHTSGLLPYAYMITHARPFGNGLPHAYFASF